VTAVQTNVGSWKLEDQQHQVEHESLTCDGCGKIYQTPIVARITTPGHVQTYGACPHCMTKVYDISAPKTEQKEKRNFSAESKRPQTEADDEVKCDHFFGFLNKRTRGTPVPERCLICERMVECLYG